MTTNKTNPKDASLNISEGVNPPSLSKSGELSQLLKDYNGYDFCGEKSCNGQHKANQLIAGILRLIVAQNDTTYAAVMKALKDERTKIMHKNGSWDWIPGALIRNKFRAELRPNIAKIFGKEQV